MKPGLQILVTWSSTMQMSNSS